MAVEKLNENEFDAAIAKGGTVLVDLFAVWCGPCRMLSPLVEELAEEHPDVAVYQVNVDESPAIAARFGVSSIPTLLCFKNGELAATAVGFCPKEQLEELISV